MRWQIRWPRLAARHVWRLFARRQPVPRRPPLSWLDGLPARPDALPPPSQPASLRHAGRRARPVSGLPLWLPAWQHAARRQPVLLPAPPLFWRPRARRRAFLRAAPPSRRRPVRRPRAWRRPVRIADRPVAPWPALPGRPEPLVSARALPRALALSRPSPPRRREPARPA